MVTIVLLYFWDSTCSSSSESSSIKNFSTLFIAVIDYHHHHLKACEIELLTIFVSLKARGLQEHNSSQVRSEWVHFLSIPYVLISSFFGTPFQIKTSDKILRFDHAEIIFKFIKK